MNPIKKLNQLSADLDTILFRRQYTDDELDDPKSGMLKGTAAGVGVLGAAYGVKKGIQGLTNRYGVTDDFGNTTATRDMISQGLKRDASAGYEAAKSRIASGYQSAGDRFGSAYNKAEDYVKRKAKKASTAVGTAWTRGGSVTSAAGPVQPMPFLRRVGRAAMAGSKAIRYEANLAQRIINLDAMLDQVNELRAQRIEFRDIAEES